MTKFLSYISAIAAFAVTVVLTGSAAAQDPLPPVPAAISITEQDGGYVLKTDDGLAIYTFDNDTEGKSVCNGQCAAAWPPVPATAENTPVGDWAVITRDDGSLQWAYKGKPVYTFRNDTATTITGDGMGGVWHLAQL